MRPHQAASNLVDQPPRALETSYDSHLDEFCLTKALVSRTQFKNDPWILFSFL